jgi:YHS domain-containing protein
MKSIEKNLDPRSSDPVCGRHMTEAQALLRTDYQGRTYLFCSEHCRMLFALDPEAFTAGEARPVTRE